MTWTFEKHKRDVRALRDGQQVAWFMRDSRGYYLADMFYEAIRLSPTRGGVSGRISAKRQSDFESIIENHAGKIPTLAQLEDRREQRKAKRAHTKTARHEIQAAR